MPDTLRQHPRATEQAIGEVADDELVARVQRDPGEFSALYERHVDAVLRYCYRRLGNWSDAEDVTSFIFAKVALALPRYQPGSFRSWLFTIAHHAVVNVYRGRSIAEPLDRANDLPAGGPTPEDVVFAVETRDLLTQALHQLPDAQRQVIELRLAGLTGPEIAQVLERSHGSVKMLQLRAIDKLRDLLQTKEGRDAR